MSQAATTLAELRKPEHSTPVEVGFTTSDSYALMRKIAVDFAASDLVPQRYQGKAPNCMIALNMALRMRADPLMVMQNLYVVHGTPAWSASFLIACFNQCGRFAPIAYKFEGQRDTDAWGCRAVSSYLADGTPVEGPLVTISIAKAEGWFAKNGSKWKTMPEQMLRYRAAAWMIRSTAPEIGMGFQTTEEVHDTYEMQRGDDGTFSVSLADMKSAHAEEAQPSPQEQPAEQPQSSQRHSRKLRTPSPAPWSKENRPTSPHASSAQKATYALSLRSTSQANNSPPTRAFLIPPPARQPLAGRHHKRHAGV